MESIHVAVSRSADPICVRDADLLRLTRRLEIATPITIR
jgi:hypothetical protein